MRFSFFPTVGSKAMPIEADKFITIIRSEQLIAAENEIIGAVKAGEDYSGIKRKLPAICWHASFPKGRRKASEAVPSGLYMLDLDHIEGNPFDIYNEKIAKRVDELGIYIVHKTPSTHGLRIVAKALLKNGFQTIEQHQRWLAEQLRVEYDAAVKDFARLSFLVPFDFFYYINQSIFTDEAEQTEFSQEPSGSVSGSMAGGETDGETDIDNPDADTDGIADGSHSNSPLPDGYRNFSWQQIAEKYFSLNGGSPQLGERNTKLYAYARVLRYICDFDHATLCHALPTYGLSKQEISQIAKSALESTRATAMPAIWERIFAELGESEVAASRNYKIPALPPVLKTFVEIAPKDFKIPSLFAALPAIGTVLSPLRSLYLDKTEHSPSLMTAIEAPQASGKSFCRRIMEIVLNDIHEEDAAARLTEQAYREQLKASKNSKTQPSDPRASVIDIPASVSIAKLLQRMDYAKGRHLFSFCEEMDTLVKSNSSGAWSQKSDLYRNAFDNAFYGQDFMSDSSYSANLKMLYNMVVTGTPASMERFFRNKEDGLCSRFIICSLENQFAAELPIFRQISDRQKAAMIAKLRKLRNQIGEGKTVEMPTVLKVLKRFLEKQRQTALRETSVARDTFRRRAAVIGFRCAMLCYALWDFAPSKEKACSDVALFVADYVLNEQIAHFGTGLEENRKEVQGRAANVFAELGDEFTSNELQAKLRKYHRATPARTILYAWSKDGLIEKTGKGIYKKVKK